MITELAMAEFTEAVKKGDETMNHDIVGKPLKKGDYEIVNFSSLRNCKNEKKSVSSGREPKPGDVIWADRNVKGLPYNHCGIYEAITLSFTFPRRKAWR